MSENETRLADAHFDELTDELKTRYRRKMNEAGEAIEENGWLKNEVNALKKSRDKVNDRNNILSAARATWKNRAEEAEAHNGDMVEELLRLDEHARRLRVERELFRTSLADTGNAAPLLRYRDLSAGMRVVARRKGQDPDSWNLYWVHNRNGYGWVLYSNPRTATVPAGDFEIYLLHDPQVKVHTTERQGAPRYHASLASAGGWCISEEDRYVTEVEAGLRPDPDELVLWKPGFAGLRLGQMSQDLPKVEVVSRETGDSIRGTLRHIEFAEVQSGVKITVDIDTTSLGAREDQEIHRIVLDWDTDFYIQRWALKDGGER